MDVLTIEAMLQREQEVFANDEATSLELMEAAGGALAERIRANFPEAKDFLVLVGKGNNGGDGLVVARHLAHWGGQVRVVLAHPENDLGQPSQGCREQLHREQPAIKLEGWSPEFPRPGSKAVVIDALLGVQARGELRNPLAEIVAWLNSAREAQFFRTVALDLPTGLAAYADGRTTPARDAAVVADLTLAVGFAKDLLCGEALAPWVGRLEVVPWSCQRENSANLQVAIPPELAPLMPRRSALSHKNDFGRVVLVAGGPGFTGAAGLCSQAALAMGSGLLSIITHADAAAVVAAQSPHEAMVSGWRDADSEVLKNATAIGIGPGLGVNEATLSMLRAVLQIGCPVLIDADALNVLAKNFDLLRDAKGPVVLTPHPGEMGRLIGRKISLEDREKVARDFVAKHRVTLVLKGTRTLIAAPGQPLYVNTTGNPGLSTGGSGDTLTGIITCLLAQKLAPVDAARLGAWLHGHAADLVLQARGCEEGLTPTMLSARIGDALVSLRSQAASATGLLEEAAKMRNAKSRPSG